MSTKALFRTIRSFSAGLALACSAFATAQVSVTIDTPTPVARSGSAIRLDVVVKNESGHAIRLYKAPGEDGQAEAANDVDVYDANAKALPRIDGRKITRQGKTLQLPKSWISRKIVPLEAGESAKDFMILSDLFDLSKPGEYLVKVRHMRPGEEDGSGPRQFYSTSNTIRIKITAAQ